MGVFDFLKRKKDNKFNGSFSSPERDDKITSKTYIELEEFLYLANKMVINNQASNKTLHVKAYITDEISEQELNILKEEINYFMLCLLHFYTFVEITLNKKILDTNDEKALNHFKAISRYSIERSFLASLNDFEYTMEKYINRYEKYTHFLGIYKYQNFERSFLECFAAQLTGGFNDATVSIDVEPTQLLLMARWIYRAYGESTKLTLNETNFIM
jgi:hypothetical protein